MNIFSLGMDSLAVEIQHYGVYATVHNLRNGRRSPTTLPPPITPAEKVRSSSLGIRLALML